MGGVTRTGAFAPLKEKHSRIDARVFPNPMGSIQSVRCHHTAKKHRTIPVLFAGEP